MNDQNHLKTLRSCLKTRLNAGLDCQIQTEPLGKPSDLAIRESRQGLFRQSLRVYFREVAR